ncbi:MAG: asparagine synthase C-terminal domain-containing protein, partial [Oscillospiraceae bacterium]|nr:asparagine synthase C-terminal domain-containing protein [Oscillospiraceae bacterium]
PAPYTVFSEIKKILPGTYVIIKPDYKKINQEKHYWSFSNIITEKSYAECKEELRELLKSAVKEQMNSDVPYGAFLSGGIDSSLVVSYMQKMISEPVKTYSIGFENNKYNEAEFAKEVAKHLGTDHHTMYVSDKEAMELIPGLSEIYDEPYADSSQIPTFFVSKFAKKEVTVSLTGDAGDELFCGYYHYPKYNDMRKKINKIPYFAKSGFVKFSNTDMARIINQRTKNNRIYKLAKLFECKSQEEFFYYMKAFDTSKDGIIKDVKDGPYYFLNSSDEKNDFISNMQKIDYMTYLTNDILVKVDRAAMANSLETRIPLLDRRIIEYAFSMPLEYKYYNGEKKRILRDLLFDEVA